MKTVTGLCVAILLLAANSEAGLLGGLVPGVSLTVNPGPVQGTSIVVPGVQTPWPGKIFVSHDEWALSDSGFAAAPDAAKLASNLAAWFSNGVPANFLVYSTNWSLTGHQLAHTMTAAGHSWTVDTTSEFTLSNLLRYNAVFVAGDQLDTSVLIDYVRAGGNVYLAGGTGWFGPALEAGRWNPFLNAFGLTFGYHRTPMSRVVMSVSSTSPIFNGVSALWMLDDYGMVVDPAEAGDPHVKTLLSYGGHGLYATYETPVIPVGVEVCPTRLPLTSSVTLTAAVVGSSTLDVHAIDPASLRLVGVAPRSTAYRYYSTATTEAALHLGKTTVSACLGTGGDGILDLVATVESRELVRSINARLGRSLVDGETVALILTGRLKPEYGGTPIVGEALINTSP